LNTAYFIAKRLIRRESTEKELSRPIVRIATIGIALGVAVMILSIGIVRGFQHEVREKVLGFGSHIQVTNFSSSVRYNDPRLEVNQDFYPHLDTLPEVKHIQQYALLQGILETPENIQGIFAKGVSHDFDWSFLQAHLAEGELPSFSDTATSNALVMSSYLARRMQINTGDKVTVYFPNPGRNMVQRNLTLVAVYNTGLQELDAQFVFIDLNHIRRINQWGLQAQMRYDGCDDGKVSLTALGFGGDGEHRYLWSADSLRGPGPHTFCIKSDTTIYAVLRDRSETIHDTAFFHVRLAPQAARLLSGATTSCQCVFEQGTEPGHNEYSITTSGGSEKYYTGGFDVILESYADLEIMDRFIYEHLNYDLRTTTITQRSPEIFNWLEMLDINTIVIIILMIIISVINMTSALLILIMERTQMIGILKTMGATSWLVQRIFLIQAAYIIGVGLVIGNIFGLGLAWLQSRYGLLKLDPQHYYVSEVPVLLEAQYILLLNALTLLVCVTMLLLPALAVNQVRPSRAIRFN
jgi:lipoprotein-releasing system permease protein